MSTTKERYQKVSQELQEICRSCGRDPHEVRLIAVSKTVGPDQVASAIEGGAHDFGENRPDGLAQKADLYPQYNWHFIGNIQSRRIGDIVGRAVLVHSLYQMHHAAKFDEIAAQKGLVQDVLVEVNVSGEESKSGISPDDAPAFLAELAAYPHVRARGFMTMAPQGDLIVARQVFADLKQLQSSVKAQMKPEEAQFFDELSMGMSEDWREAVSQGATMVRIGRAIFSDTFEA